MWRLIILILAFGNVAVAADAPPVCATAAQAGQVAAAYVDASRPPALPALAATRLAVPEAVVLSALQPAVAAGASAAGFQQVWKSLQAWDEAVTLVLKGGSVFEIRGRIPAGIPSEKSQFFNLQSEGAGLGGHLRPDLLGALYAVNLVNAKGSVRGVTFVDPRGEGVFGVYLPEGAEPSAALLAQFEATRALITSLPRVCGPAG